MDTMPIDNRHQEWFRLNIHTALIEDDDNDDDSRKRMPKIVYDDLWFNDQNPIRSRMGTNITESAESYEKTQICRSSPRNASIESWTGIRDRMIRLFTAETIPRAIRLTNGPNIIEFVCYGLLRVVMHVLNERRTGARKYDREYLLPKILLDTFVQVCGSVNRYQFVEHCVFWMIRVMWWIIRKLIVKSRDKFNIKLYLNYAQQMCKFVISSTIQIRTCSMFASSNIVEDVCFSLEWI